MIITTLNIHRGFIKKYLKITKEFAQSDVICLQETGIITIQEVQTIEASKPYKVNINSKSMYNSYMKIYNIKLVYKILTIKNKTKAIKVYKIIYIKNEYNNP